MLRTFSGLFIAFALVFGFSAQAGAQDRNCDDFATQEEAQAYFEAGGGSTANNFNGLDRDRDGIACEDNPSGDGGAGAGEDEAPAAQPGTGLPSTGAGTAFGGDSSTSLTLGLLVTAGVFGVAGLRARRA